MCRPSGGCGVVHPDSLTYHRGGDEVRRGGTTAGPSTTLTNTLLINLNPGAFENPTKWLQKSTGFHTPRGTLIIWMVSCTQICYGFRNEAAAEPGLGIPAANGGD